VRFLVDECVSRRIVNRLLAEQHDVIWIAETGAGGLDRDVLRWSLEDSRVLLTEDWDFGELAVRFREPAFGIAIVAVSQFRGNSDKTAERVVRVLGGIGDALIGAVTIIEAGRVRQRDLDPPGQQK
jgi:predicted nuclease of predicted toxin-antitoxin system